MALPLNGSDDLFAREWRALEGGTEASKHLQLGLDLLRRAGIGFGVPTPWKPGQGRSDLGQSLLSYNNQRVQEQIDCRLASLKQFLLDLSRSDLVGQGGAGGRGELMEKLLPLSQSGLERLGAAVAADGARAGLPAAG
jgi:hypothetical protein